ncbi:MAG TPA: TlyA family RNA methyltransferase [Ktedonobacterales bacterium]|jgi:23S rRNA (cytidine1920-2'-O)/16S rRNA (cytidine1409-2'-O)-methyltransferase|nr:TlyA family RNA methyltransferase [Ktedonobacterales bacterium]
MATDAQATADEKPRKPRRERLDVLLVQRGLAPSRERARAIILAGEVHVNGRVSTKAGMLVPVEAEVELVGRADELRFVSRGGLKLERALDAFGLDPAGCVCLDAGASTGGFTDALLRRGAARVYAVDVGHGQMAWTLRNDPRVVVMERTNIRHLQSLPEPIDGVVIDVSFISLRLVLPRIASLVREGAWGVALVKPQFEAGRAEADRGAGVISDPAIHRRVLRELLAWLEQMQIEGDHRRLYPQGLIASPITGREGNAEYLLWFKASAAPDVATDIKDSHVGTSEVEAAVAAAFSDVLLA